MIRVITLSTKINLQKVQSDFNKSIPSTIATFSGEKDDCITKLGINFGCSWNGEVKKKGNVTISGLDQSLNFAMPLHVWAKVKSKEFGIGGNFTTDFTVTANAFPRLDSDWSLNLNLDADFKWDKRAEIRFFFIKISVGKLTEPVIREQLRKVEEQIKAQIRSLDIRGNATQAWKKAHEPIKLSSDPVVWLRLKPKVIRFSGVHTQNNILNASVSMDADMETILGERPDGFPILPLPEIGEQGQGRNKFLVRLPIVLEYEALGKEVEKMLRVGQKWAPIRDKPNHYLFVKEVEIYPSGENIVVGINFIADLPDDWQDTRGKVYFKGKPVIDNEQRMVKFDNLDFTRTTDNTLINVISFFLKKRIRSGLSSILVYRFANEYERLIENANVELNSDLGDGVTSQGNINYAKIDKVVMLERGIYLSVIAEGILQLNFGL